MTPDINFEIRTAGRLNTTQRAEIIRLCTAAYEESFDHLFEMLPGSAHVLARQDGRLVSHAAWVARQLQSQGRELHTAYVEAVATAPEYQRHGFASVVMKELAVQIGGYDLGALSPSDAAFYERLGWESWRGPLAIRTESGLLPTPNEEVMVLRLANTPELDLSSQLTAEWRVGELW